MLKQRLKLLKDEYEHYFTDGRKIIWLIGLQKTLQREGKIKFIWIRSQLFLYYYHIFACKYIYAYVLHTHTYTYL